VKCGKKQVEESVRKFIRVMKALSDPNRVLIMKALEKKEMCVCEIRALVKLAQPTVSKHMNILEDAGLVARRKDKLWVNYSLADGSDSVYAANLIKALGNWLDENGGVVAIKNEAELVDRNNL